MTATQGTSPRMERILEATRDLTLREGVRAVTISEIAKLAGVGRGTLYLYWTAKEDLLADLFAHDFLDVLAEVAEAVRKDPAQIMPHNLLALVERTLRRHTFVSPAHPHSQGLLGVITAHPGIRELTRTLGPLAMFQRIFPVLRRHGLIRDDLTLDTQVHAISALLHGLDIVAEREPVADLLSHSDPQAVLSQVCVALLEPSAVPDPGPAAEEALDELERARTTGITNLRTHGLGKTLGF